MEAFLAYKAMGNVATSEELSQFEAMSEAIAEEQHKHLVEKFKRGKFQPPVSTPSVVRTRPNWLRDMSRLDIVVQPPELISQCKAVFLEVDRGRFKDEPLNFRIESWMNIEDVVGPSIENELIRTLVLESRDDVKHSALTVTLPPKARDGWYEYPEWRNNHLWFDHEKSKEFIERIAVAIQQLPPAPPPPPDPMADELENAFAKFKQALSDSDQAK